MGTGLISKWEKTKQSNSIVRYLRGMLDLEYIKDIPKAVYELIEENKKLKKQYETITLEFKKKKIGNIRIILNKKKSKSYKEGVLYFNKKHIGKRVIVWEKGD